MSVQGVRAWAAAMQAWPGHCVKDCQGNELRGHVQREQKPVQNGSCVRAIDPMQEDGGENFTAPHATHEQYDHAPRKPKPRSDYECQPYIHL
mmetsp:Transcript_36367/g.66623  ORF Transcript_36367/g.66623 Transcript_36367/m.66623 type:complete len:92 (-) Transcript_36367:491-766(-)